jgi:hypothetical protein
MILVPEVLAILFLNIFFILFGGIAFFISLRIIKNWDFHANTQKQYTLEKQSYLTATIIKYILAIKIPLFLFFVFTLDKLSLSVTGAMCAAGIVDATPYGNYLFILKVLNLYLFGFWILLNSYDMSLKIPKYTKIKFALYGVAFLLLTIEIIVETLMFYSIDPSKIVSCCGTLFSSNQGSYISSFFQIKTPILLSIFYGTYLLMIILYLFKRKHLFSIANVCFLIISIISLILFFGTYIYELPTHHCPFCFLQKDYYYVGYLLYSLLFLGTFFGILTSFRSNTVFFQRSLFFNTFYLIIVTAYPLSYYIRNGVWL